MRSTFIISASAATVMAIMLGLTSCNEEARLAKNLQGTWSGVPESLSTDMAGTTTIVETYNFEPDPQQKAGGSFIIQAMISANGVMPQSDEIVQPYAITASAAATATGTWTVVDDDEVTVSIDPQTIKVTLDPEAVMFNTDLLTGAEAATLDSIKPAMMGRLDARFRRDVMTRFTELRHLDDVKVKDNQLRYEVGKTHYIMSRQLAQ